MLNNTKSVTKHLPRRGQALNTMLNTMLYNSLYNTKKQLYTKNGWYILRNTEKDIEQIYMLCN